MPNQLGTAKIWDAQSGVLLFVLKDNNKTAASASFSPDGKKILTVSLDGTAKI
jgi:WD40 repeat protein